MGTNKQAVMIHMVTMICLIILESRATSILNLRQTNRPVLHVLICSYLITAKYNFDQKKDIRVRHGFECFVLLLLCVVAAVVVAAAGCGGDATMRSCWWCFLGQLLSWFYLLLLYLVCFFYSFPLYICHCS